ncbi:hypothetical protein [Rhizobium leguminosarum]|uniref:hypothetical protein n=1 Tax=Rhizobium leguminosarum TaxID=384 RepID=UPI001039BC70|nr:hypothetical protein [Rhizobium leguminosarum]TBZ07778.1 hypothetical protein E0H38_29575 [Rhizobium leguminosarum bv. viciae]
MSKKPSKSETLTIRLDPKTRFMLEFVSRLRGQTITTVVERAITEAANRATIEQEYEDDMSWRNFWSVVEGERAINIAKHDALHPSYDEERRLRFAEQFWQFFFYSASKDSVRTSYIEVLWPRIDEFIAMYDATKGSDYFAAGKAMKEALLSANLAPPDWPQVAKSKAEEPSTGNFNRNLDDDDIPF